MGAEIGATTSTFGYDEKHGRVSASYRSSRMLLIASKCIKEHLTGDAEVYANPEKYFDQVIEIDLRYLEPTY